MPASLRQSLHWPLAIVLSLAIGSPAAFGAEGNEEGRFRWRLASSWSVATPVTGEIISRFAQELRTASQGRIDLRVEEPSFHKSPLGVLDMVRSGSHELGFTASHFIRSRDAPLPFFAALAAGMNDAERLAWYHGGEGMKRVREFLSLQGVYPHLLGNAWIERGLWTRRELKSAEDLRGLRLRVPGDPAPAFTRLGLRAISIPAADLPEALAQGRIDALEWPGANETALAESPASPLFYYPGWLDPGAELVFLVNREKFAKLPPDLQILLTARINALAGELLGAALLRHQARLEKLGKSRVAVRALPRAIVQALHEANEEVVREQAERSADWQEAYQDRQTFTARWREWQRQAAGAAGRVGAAE